MYIFVREKLRLVNIHPKLSESRKHILLVGLVSNQHVHFPSVGDFSKHLTSNLGAVSNHYDRGGGVYHLPCEGRLVGVIKGQSRLGADTVH